MTVSTYSIPEAPPAELLAELVAAADALDALTARAVEPTLAMDEESRSLRIELRQDGELQALTQLFELLG